MVFTKLEKLKNPNQRYSAGFGGIHDGFDRDMYNLLESKLIRSGSGSGSGSGYHNFS